METKRQTAGWKRWLSVQAYGAVTALYGARTPPLTMRRRFERLAAVGREAVQAKYSEVAFSDHHAGELWIEGVRAVPSPRRVVLYLHGGAYLFGSPASYRNRAMRVSFRCDAEVFVPDYRLAPEHPYPAALEDALAAYAYVRAQRPGVPIVVAGDSAGGGLAISLLAALRDRGDELPDGAFVLSPWTDLAGTGASMDGNEGKDVWLGRRHLEAWARHYIGGADPEDPGISPVHADLAGLPPLFLLAGGSEVLLDDTLRVEAKARAAGVDVEVCIGRAMQHDFPLTLPWLEESREAWGRVVAFLDRCTGIGRSATSARPAVRRSQAEWAHGLEPGRDHA